jgi:hypothetical protein
MGTDNETIDRYEVDMERKMRRFMALDKSKESTTKFGLC